MAEDNTDLNSRGALVIPNGFVIGEAAGGGDCFFDSVAQGMNELCIAGGPFDVSLLRQACFEYARIHKDSVYDSQIGKTWHQIIAEDAVAGGYASGGRHEHAHFESYLAHIQLTAAKEAVLNLCAAIWGRPEIEGRMLCEKFGIKLHVIENFHSSGQEVIGHQLVHSSGTRSVVEHPGLYNDAQIIHILNEGFCHFVPILCKTSVHLSPSEGVQSQNNPTQPNPVKSVAASPQQVSLLVAQPEHPEQGPEKIDSAYEAKTHQAIDGRYLKECSLTDKSTWSAVAAEKEKADFKILRITNSPTISAALVFMQQEEFYETFKQASHWFFIVIEVDDGSKFPSKVLECLAEVFDEQKPVIIQWDLMHPKEHLVCFKPTGKCALTPLPMNSVSLFSMKDELTLELFKQGSFQLPLLLNAVQLRIGGQFKGDTLDLLNVSFDVNQEIDTWRLVDYAARDDDSLSLRFLLLVDWDLHYQNGDERRTLEIATEFGGPQSVSALLNLPITSSAKRMSLSYKEENLLALPNCNGDNPLLIAAQNKNPDTLKFLIHCIIDLHCHRKEDARVTPIWLAWNEKLVENMHVLLEADSPFPHDFDLDAFYAFCENSDALLMQVKARQRFHQAIKEGSQHDVQEYIKCHPRLKRAYDPRNHSALMTALEAEQFEIYALLQSEEFDGGKNEQLLVEIERLPDEKKCRLKKAKLKYFEKQNDAYVKFLESKSKLGFGQENKKDIGIIRELYKKLDAIPEISTILKVVEWSEVTEIIFDFDRDSIVDLDPTQSSTTSGVCEYRAGRIYVGAKDQSELPGTLAHELTHLAMQVCYDNQCNPYEESDEERKSVFDDVVSYYHKKKGVDSIIERVFSVYGESSWPSELIVRVPHLLARYSGEKDKQLITQLAPELFQFYEQHTQEDLRRFVDNPASIKARHEIQRLNKQLGKIDEIEQSKIWLNDECLLKNEVLNCPNVQLLSSPLPQLTIMHLYQVMRRKLLSISDIRGGYIFVSAEQFRNKAEADSVFQAFKSDAHPTLIIDCSYEYYKSSTDLWSTIDSFSNKRKIIFIAVSDVAWSLQDKLKECRVTKIQYKWSDLDFSSQKALLESTVNFQGIEVSLNQLIPTNSKLTEVLPLADLLGAKTLEIGEPVMTSASHSCDASYCTRRTFNHQVTIKHEIFEQTSDLLTTAEHRFRQLCQNNPESNVHWLWKDDSGKLIWQQSKGSLRALRGYIDARNPLPYPLENLDEFLQQAQNQKVMLIADIAGMGKTTVLTHLSEQIKQKFPTYWVVRVDLNGHADVLEAQTKQNIGTNEFLSEKLLKLRSPFEKELFKQYCQGLDEATKVILMFDGFDEISPKYKKTVLDLLQDLNPLKQPWIEQLWVTTRPHLRGELEDSLQQLCYTLKPFSEDNQVGFLTTFWHQQECHQQQLETNARALIGKIAQSINDKDKEFTGVPLQTRKVAEYFEEEVKTCLSQKPGPQLPKQLCLVDLYREIIKDKIDIFSSKGKIAKEQLSDITVRDISITKNHRKLAFELLLPKLRHTVIKLEAPKLLSCEQISRIGILQYVDDTPYFVHHSFAEYYVAEFLVEKFTTKTNVLPQQRDLFHRILMEAEFQVIRLFMDEFLLKSKPSKVNLKQYGKQIHKIWTEDVNSKWTGKQNQLTREKLRTIFHQAAKEGNFHIIVFLLDSLKACYADTNQKAASYSDASLKAASYSDTVKDLLLYINRDGETVWHLAVQGDHTEKSEVLKRWENEMHLNLSDDLLLAEDVNGHTA